MTAERVMDRRSAAELRAIDNRVIQIEDTAAWKRVRRLSNRAHLSLIAGREDWAMEHIGEIGEVAGRRLRQLGGSDEAA